MDTCPHSRQTRRVSPTAVVLSTKEPALFWHENRDGLLARTEPPSDGVFRSKVFPGLWLNAEAALSNDTKTVLQTLRDGLADAGHAAFVSELAGRRAK